VIRVGVIGAGRVAELVHVPSLRLFQDVCEVTAVCSRDKVNASVFAQRWAIPKVYDGWRDLVADPAIDAVVVCVPSAVTPEVALAAVEADKHVLCEKPIALTCADAEVMAEAGQRTGRVHMVAFTYRFAPGLRLLHRVVAEGRLGEVRLLRWVQTMDLMLDPSKPVTWRNVRAQAGEGVLTDMGTHAFDTALWLLGDIEAVSGVGQLFTRERPTRSGQTATVDAEDACSLTARFTSGALGSFDFNRAVAARGGLGTSYLRIELYGTEGQAAFESSRPAELELVTDSVITGCVHVHVPEDLRAVPGSRRSLDVEDPIRGYKLDQGAAFVNAILCQSGAFPTFHDAVRVHRVVEAVADSIRRQRWVAPRRHPQLP
jgi:predicted dehydrogenase